MSNATKSATANVISDVVVNDVTNNTIIETEVNIPARPKMVLAKELDPYAERLILTSRETDNIFNNPNSTDFIEEHWAWISTELTFKNKLWRILANPAHISIIEKHWDWFLTNCDFTTLYHLSENSAAVHLIERHWDELLMRQILFWQNLCSNEKAVHLIDRHWDWLVATSVLEVDNVDALLQNKCAVPLITKRWTWFVQNHSKRLFILGKNPNAYELVRDNFIWIKNHCNVHDSICYMPHTVRLYEDKFELLTKHLLWRNYSTLYICSGIMSLMPRLMAQFPKLLDEPRVWQGLAQNTDLEVMTFLDEHMEQMIEVVGLTHFEHLCANPSAVGLLEKHWTVLTKNHKISAQHLFANDGEGANRLILRLTPSLFAKTVIPVDAATREKEFLALAGNKVAVSYILETISWLNKTSNEELAASKFAELMKTDKSAIYSKLAANPGIFIPLQAQPEVEL